VWNCIRDLKTCELQLSESLSSLERDWLIGSLISKRGVNDAAYCGADTNRLLIEYDADLTNRARLMDYLYTCGVHVEPAPPSWEPQAARA